ncbi:glycoside hydrolase family 18 protein [Coniophora puteana RWD-64-598 SS2]|uniref:Glycoside hydrolase family 18 protein n=1 Tax=Coniophora puteana (strain RWD-64-598) TaxID=741705 RepID=A0A5M3MDR2_CONPW|nr:glycoside hydrolase family 18 protein [Coniophora puteana RWD-64-598 SS2]EIW77020.1 glycoside hydrolase family 18 protein [Coniophora puteana RWD-64-598 SS2]
MVAFTSALTALCAAALSVTGAIAAPLTQSLSTRATPAAPHFVAYSDKWISGETGPPATSALTGYNVFALSFWRPAAAVDQALEWATIDAATRNSTLSAYKTAGISLVVSAFGADFNPTSGSPALDPTQTADQLAAWVIQYGLNGVDIDYEDFDAMNKMDGSAEQWLITFTTELRSKLPAADYIISHAPVGPWFSTKYTSGGYLKVDKQVGSMIDWYNVQFYNQGTTEYSTCDGLLTTSSTTYPNSALFQIVASGVAADKLVIGKPGTTGDETNGGYMSASDLASCLQQATAKKWNAGVMVWEYPDAAADWIKSVRALAFPE